MPKVTQEYIDNKKKFIVDAAYQVCLRKPVEMVTMMDVIEETGLSQGGIYRFYKDLDDIKALIKIKTQKLLLMVILVMSAKKPGFKITQYKII